MDHRWHYVDTVRSTMSVILYPLRAMVDLSTSPFRSISHYFTSKAALIEQVETLRTRQMLLETQLQRMVTLEAENRRLRRLLHSSMETRQETRVAEIIAVDLDPFSRQVVINKGSNDDVFPGQPLLDANGVMGQVIHVGPFSSTALLITAPSHATPVEVNRNGLRAIAMGTGTRFPPGHPVATISRVENLPSRPYALVEATPTANLDGIREVLLVWTTPANGLSEAETEPSQVTPEANHSP